MSHTTLIHNGTLVTPAGEMRGDLLLANEQIVAIGLDLPDEGVDQVVDASGCVVMPGLIDPHTHIQLDTGIYKTPDNWEIGTRTAACGGVTTVIDFATQFPEQDVREALAARLAEAGESAQIDYALHMMLTELPAADAELDRWMANLVAEGVTSVKVYTTYRPNYYQDDAAFLRVFRAAARHDVTVMIHCENDAIVTAATNALVAAGQTSLANHGRARPPIAEVEAANRMLFLANAVETKQPRVYIVHCSVGGTVDQVSQAVTRGQRAISETTPQYLLLDETAYAGPHPEWDIMQPPLRAPEEKERLWERVASGAVSTIGTDHCDYTINQKHLSPHFNETAGGIPGLETMLPLLVTYGVNPSAGFATPAPAARRRGGAGEHPSGTGRDQGRISWVRLAELTSANPARIFGLPHKGMLLPGYDADIVIYDPRGEGVIRADRLHNIAGYTPYEGWRVQGAVRDVFSRGRTLVRDGEFLPAPGWGRFVRGKLTTEA